MQRRAGFFATLAQVIFLFFSLVMDQRGSSASPSSGHEPQALGHAAVARVPSADFFLQRLSGFLRTHLQVFADLPFLDQDLEFLALPPVSYTHLTLPTILLV